MNTTPVMQKNFDFYKQLYITLRNIPKRDRYTWGEKCEHLAIQILADLAKASFLPKYKKRQLILEASTTLDLLKIFLRLGHELKILNRKQYIIHQGELQTMGKMIGGWLKTV